MKKKKEIDVRNLYICNGYSKCNDNICEHAKPHPLEHYDYKKIPTCEYEDFCMEIDAEVKCIKMAIIEDFFIEDEEMELN